MTSKKPVATAEQDGDETRSVVPADWRAKYKERGGSCGDELAERLRRHLAAQDGTIDLAKRASSPKLIESGGRNMRN